MLVIAPRPDRASDLADFTSAGALPENVYPVGSPGFLYWQCREAALSAVAMWESVSGSPVRSWQAGRRLAMILDDTQALDASYDRDGLRFNHQPGVGKTYFTAASTDVVAHEVGHAILDSLRPDLWRSDAFETNAFHEAFGDCVAVLTALHHPDIRTQVAAAVAGPNFVEALMEELADGYLVILGPTHNRSAPRRALNPFRHADPNTLPSAGGPGVLIGDAHSFGQVFTGCFYDLIVKLVAAGGDLLAAAQTAGRLLAEAVKTVPVKDGLFAEVGGAMLQADQALFASANQAAIREAFHGHGLDLATATARAAASPLSAPPDLRGRGKLPPKARRELRARLGTPRGAKTTFETVPHEAGRVGRFTHERPVDCGRIDPRLAGVVAKAVESVHVARLRTRGVVLGRPPEPAATDAEVEAFVRSLLTAGTIDFGGGSRAARVRGADRPRPVVTHKLVGPAGRKVLTRVRFTCGFGGPPA